MVTVRLARAAMASRFELVLHGEDEVWLRAAGEEALAEVDRLEAQLSIFRPSSEISRINARAAEESVRVEPRLFHLLQTAGRLHEETAGAFDITVAPLMRAWGFFRDSGHLPDPEVLREARERTGMRFVHLDESTRSVRFERAGVMLDLGAIGKGYAVDEAIRILRDTGVEHALLHGGTSTVFAFGRTDLDAHWKVAIEFPESSDEPLAVVPLENASLSVSAVWGKSFEVGGVTYGHVLDPRIGRPVEGAALAAVVCDSAAEADALSTALLVSGRSFSVDPRRVRALAAFPPDADGRVEVVDAGLAACTSDHIRVETLDTISKNEHE